MKGAIEAMAAWNVRSARFRRSARLSAAAAPWVLGLLILSHAPNVRPEEPESGTRAVQRSSGGVLARLGGASGWINSPPLTAADLRGKVVLVQFWTYTCINWRRSLPYVRAWASRYKDEGLVVIGVHTPEFAFERDAANVRWAVRDMEIPYPVALDSDRAIWNAFENEYWPALYFIDAQGRIRHRSFGEGDYERSERVIQKLLAEAGARGVTSRLTPVDPRPAEVAADWEDLKSPETYLRNERASDFTSTGGLPGDEPRTGGVPAKLDEWALSGKWTVGRDGARLDEGNGRIVLRFHARDLHLVMGPRVRGNAVRFRVLIDGHSPGEAHGSDVDARGDGTAVEQRLYQLVRQQPPIGDRRVEIEFADPGVEAFVFTFG